MQLKDYIHANLESSHLCWRLLGIGWPTVLPGTLFTTFGTSRRRVNAVLRRTSQIYQFHYNYIHYTAVRRLIWALCLSIASSLLLSDRYCPLL